MSPALLSVLRQLKLSLKRDLNVLQGLVNQKSEEYVKISSMLYHMDENLEAMESEFSEKVVINCDPPEVDEEGRLI